MADDLKEYVVTLKNKEDLNDFYNDMETPGGDLYIPDRAVDVSARRSISRNTHYMLSDTEVEQLRNDPRVLAVDLPPKAKGIEIVRFWEQAADFEKGTSITSTDKNWGLYRVTAGDTVSNWGVGGSFTQYNGTAKTTSSGKNVDVVIVDAHINPNHPEFAVNPDGTGGSRVNQYNWFSLNSVLGISPGSSTYSYATISSNHGTHVAGTAVGNTQGWARDANIYHIEFDYAGTFTPGNWELYLFDYLRAFHLNKPINPETGRRNPTITNHSWGYSYGNNSGNLSDTTRVRYRGVTTDISSQSTAAKKITLEANGCPVVNITSFFRMPARYAALDADIEDAIDEGVVIIAAAGNSYWNTAKEGDIDYNNFVRIGSFSYFHSEGSSPAGAAGVISVGNIGERPEEYKRNSSNFGSGVDIWAPGSNIVSAVYDTTAASEFGITLANDPRDSNYKIGSISGTSMASPQVCGVIACYAEQNPNINNSEALAYLIATSKKDQIASTGSDYGDFFWLGDNSNNRYLFYKLERQLTGTVFPNRSFKNRPTSGSVYPRTRIRAKG